MTLTELSRRLAALHDLPLEERSAAARSLRPLLDEVLTEQVSEETARSCWIKLARAARPGLLIRGDVHAARAAALSAVDGDDTAGTLRQAGHRWRAAIQQERAAAEDAYAAIRTAVSAGWSEAAVSRELGVTRTTVRRATTRNSAGEPSDSVVTSTR